MLAGMSGDRMEPPDDLGYSTAEAHWITEGPNSGGIAGWLLHDGHMFEFRHEGHSGDVFAGIPVREWLALRAEREPRIAEDLRRRLDDASA